MLQRSILCMQGTQYATKRSILCRGAFCGPTQHYITNCVSHQNTCNYSLSASDYNNYIDSYDFGGKLTLNSFNYLFYLQYWLKSRNETLKQTLIIAIAKNCFKRNGFCPTYDKRHAYTYGSNRSISNHNPF